MFNEVSYYDNWMYCVSTSTSYLSLSWEEHFFDDEECAKKYYQAAKDLGLAVLMVDRDCY